MIRFLRIVLAAALLCLFLPAAVEAQAPSRGGEQPLRARAYISPEAPNTTTSFRLVLEISGSRIPQVTEPTLPKMTNARPVSGPMTETTRQSTNGVVRSTVRLSWTLIGESPGPGEIPAISVQVGGQSLRTEALKFQIAAGPDPARAGSSAKASADEAVFLSARLDGEEVWVGQPVKLEVTLFSIPQVTNLGWDSRPTLGEYWTEMETVDLETEQYQADIRGRTYTAYPIERQILIPTAAGEFEIDPFVAQVQVRTRSRRAFDFFDFGRSAVVTRATPPLPLKVRQLPRQGQPKDFSGAIGTFKVNAELDRTDAEVDDAVALRVTVDGDGSLRSVGAPQLKLPVDLEVFDPQLKESSFRRSGKKFKSRKSWEWIVVPVAPGSFEVPSVEFSYFDPERGRYATATAEGLKLAVQRGDGRPDPIQSTRTLATAQKELHYIKPLDGRLRKGSPRLHERGVFPYLLGLPLLLTPLAILLGRRRSRLNRDHGQLRSRRSRGRARKQLRSIRKRIDHLDSAEFHEEVGRTLVEYVADRFNRSGAGLTYDAADELLASRGIDPELGRRYRACLERCDFARFVPSAGQAERKQELLTEAAELIDALEQGWK